MSDQKFHFEHSVFSSPHYNFTFHPHKDTLDIVSKFFGRGRVLDLGCGEGGTSLALAEKFFEVTSVDISQTAINNLQFEAQARDLELSPLCLDVEEYDITMPYDIVLGLGVFHFLSREHTLRLIEQSKSQTTKGGIHVIEAFVDGDFSQEDNKTGCYFEQKELKELYADWKIVEYEDFSEPTHEGDHKMVWLVAQKP